MPFHENLLHQVFVVALRRLGHVHEEVGPNLVLSGQNDLQKYVPAARVLKIGQPRRDHGVVPRGEGQD